MTVAHHLAQQLADHLVLLGGGSSDGGDPPGGGGGVTVSTTADSGSLLSYLATAVALVGGAVSAVNAWSNRRRRIDAETAAAKARAETSGIQVDGTIKVRQQDSSDLAAEREYARENRERADRAMDRVREVERAHDRDRRRWDERLDALDDRLRAFARTVMSCPVPDPPGCPLGQIATTAAQPAEITAAPLDDVDTHP